jgi:hypothetical protein
VYAGELSIARSSVMQTILSTQSLAEFYHADFAREQVEDLCALAATSMLGATIVDLGGGVGHFAELLRTEHGADARVLDLDSESVRRCLDRSVPASVGDAITTRAADGADFAAFNMILHHLVGAGFHMTEKLQTAALANLANPRGPKRVFVSEFVYEGYIPNWPAALIFAVTSSKMLSKAGASVARVVPSLRANTFGTGVRFRAASDWTRMFARSGWRVSAYRTHPSGPIGVAKLMALGLRSWRRDSFLLERSSLFLTDLPDGT